MEELLKEKKKILSEKADHYQDTLTKVIGKETIHLYFYTIYFYYFDAMNVTTTFLNLSN